LTAVDDRHAASYNPLAVSALRKVEIPAVHVADAGLAEEAVRREAKKK